VITAWDMRSAERRYFQQQRRRWACRRRPSRVQEDLAKRYDRHGVLREIEEGPVEFALDNEVRRAI